LFKTGTAVRNVVRRTPTTSGLQWRLVTKVPVRGAGGRIELLVGVSRDITDLVEVQELLEAVVDALPQSVWVKDDHGVFRFSNRSFAKRHGYSDPKDVEGKTDFNHWSPEIARQYKKEDIERIRLEKNDYHVRVNTVSRSGEKVVLDVSKIVLNRADGRPQLLCVFDDVTKRVGDERKAIEGDISRLIGHCFKNWIELLSEDTEKLRQAIPALGRVEGYKRVVAGYRYLSQATQKAIYSRSLNDGLSPVRFSVSDAIAAVVNHCHDRRILVSGTKRLFYSGSKCHFENALLELIKNAQRELSIDGGKIEIGVAAKRHGFVVTVADNGPGVPAAIRGKEFELFSKGKMARSGLGLSYVREVCRAHGGEARRLESQRGAVFEMEFASK